ncbi:hypothetical protein FF100_35565 [Methylobacterium terricola]|uniref:Abortive infection bacteriophage resistance protein n=1 Tax=Methylobacterium terricola TaxID=2583531 RepID=A0A5C4L4U8_9HYPH|nr:Abi family protein [Methylobacterium terricola]TNC05524.1 hypothetical protein FF100_35565 [Methylobacterium terricola]
MEAPQGGFLLSKIDFAKPALNINDQIELLKERGLEIDDERKATYFLTYVGYYRLSGYFRYYADPNDPQLERLKPGTSFEHLMDVYAFDRRLRALLSRSFERIEVAIKATLSGEGAVTHGPFWLCDETHFDRGSHGHIKMLMDEYIGDRKAAHQHIFINHFMQKYSNPYPPCWMMMELFSFGAISKIYKNAKGPIRIKVASHFGLQHDILESWLHSLSFARNVCAHHGRIWNRKFTIKPKIPKVYASHWPASSHDRLYVLCAMIWHLINIIDGNSPWKKRLLHLIDTRPNIPLRAMGFSDGWADTPPWSTPQISGSTAKAAL